MCVHTQELNAQTFVNLRAVLSLTLSPVRSFGICCLFN